LGGKKQLKLARNRTKKPDFALKSLKNRLLCIATQFGKGEETYAGMEGGGRATYSFSFVSDLLAVTHFHRYPLLFQ
jgi:hypothetical protein